MTNKEFVKDYVPWSALRNTLFKGLKFNDYDEIVKRFLPMVGCDRIEQYVNEMPEMTSQGEGCFPDSVDANGQLNPGGGFHLSLAAYDYDVICCICECPQTVSVSSTTWRKEAKCKGCKRKIQVTVSKEEGVQVKEINP